MKGTLFVGCALVLGLATSADAYVGPGVGITMIGWFAGFVVIVGAALWATLRLPLQWLMTRLRPAPDKDESSDERQD